MQICEPVRIQSPFVGISFDSEWLCISPDGSLTVKASIAKPYAWDGCTPKFNVLDLFVLGTPDGRRLSDGWHITQRASLVHDALCQYDHVLSISRAEIDRLFLDMLQENRFALAKIYYWAVRTWTILTGKKR